MSGEVDVDFVGEFELDEIQVCKNRLVMFAQAYGLKITGSLKDRGAGYTGILIFSNGIMSYGVRSKGKSLSEFLDGFCSEVSEVESFSEARQGWT